MNRWIVVAAALVCAGQASAAGGEAASAPPSGAVFAEALRLGMELQAQREALERKALDPAVTSPEIAAARKALHEITSRWDGKGDDEERAAFMKEREAAQQAVRALVFAHPDVLPAVKAFEAAQARLADVHRQVEAIREREKGKPAAGDEQAGAAAPAE